MLCPHCLKTFIDPGRSKGGRNSRRTITPAQQAAMQKARRENKSKKGLTFTSRKK